MKPINSPIEASPAFERGCLFGGRNNPTNSADQLQKLKDEIAKSDLTYALKASISSSVKDGPSTQREPIP